MKNFAVLIICSFIFFSCDNSEEITFPMGQNSDPIPCEPDIPIQDSIQTIYDISIGTWDGSTILSRENEVVTVGYEDCSDSTKMAILITEQNGDLISLNSFNVLFNSRALGVTQDPHGNYLIVGYSYTESWTENRKLTIAKTNEIGELLWINTYYEAENITGDHISYINDDYIIASGHRDGDLVFQVIDSSGSEIFSRIYRSDYWGTPSSMLILEDGNILITGEKDQELHLACYTTSSSLIWEKTYGPQNKSGRSTIQLSNGDLVTVGRNSLDLFILKTDKNGNEIWQNTIAYDKSIDGQSIAQNLDGGFVITGYYSSEHTDHFLVLTDSLGREENRVLYTDFGPGRGNNIFKVENDRNIITGSRNGSTFIKNVDNFGKN